MRAAWQGHNLGRQRRAPTASATRRAGGELLAAVAEKGSYSEADARGCFAQLLSGVAYLHSHGIAHRDIKLENLLLVAPGDVSRVRIVDFGLAKGHVAQSYLEMDTICGTPHYVAPEIIAVRPPRPPPLCERGGVGSAPLPAALARAGSCKALGWAGSAQRRAFTSVAGFVACCHCHCRRLSERVDVQPEAASSIQGLLMRFLATRAEHCTTRRQPPEAPCTDDRC